MPVPSPMSRSYYHTVFRRLSTHQWIAIRMSDTNEICRAAGMTREEAFANLTEYRKKPSFLHAFPTNAKNCLTP